MPFWREFVAFVRGTRPRPPPGPRRPDVAVVLVAASLMHLPLIYLLVGMIDVRPAFGLSVGLIAMGLAWAGGVALEGRRGGTVRGIAVVAIVEGVLAAALASGLGSGRLFFALIALLSAVALLLAARPGLRVSRPS